MRKETEEGDRVEGDRGRQWKETERKDSYVAVATSSLRLANTAPFEHPQSTPNPHPIMLGEGRADGELKTQSTPNPHPIHTSSCGSCELIANK